MSAETVTALLLIVVPIVFNVAFFELGRAFDYPGRAPGLIRSHVDVCDPNLVALKALIELRDEVRDIVDLRLIAFPQDGVLSFPDGKELMREAMRLGCDVIGGIPHYEWTRDDGVEEVHFIFDLAKETGAPIDLHCDETDDEQSRFLEVVAARAMRDGMQGRVVAGHTTAFGSYNDAYAFKLLQILKRAGVTIVANPLDNIVLQGRFDTYPKRRGMTRVKELDAAGVNVACGHDSIMDPWYPLGRGSMLDALSMLVHVAQMTGRTELFRAWEMVTTNPARAAEVPWGVKEGLPANFVIFDATDEAEAIRLRPAARWVVRLGKGRGRDGAGAERRAPRRDVDAGHLHQAADRLRGEGDSGLTGPRRAARTQGKGALQPTWRPTRCPSRGCPPTKGDLSIEAHGMDPIPEIGALRLGRPGVHGLVHAEPGPGGVLHRDARDARLPEARVRRPRSSRSSSATSSARRRSASCPRWARRLGMAQIPVARLPFGKSIVAARPAELVQHDRLGRHQQPVRRAGDHAPDPGHPVLASPW